MSYESGSLRRKLFIGGRFVDHDGEAYTSIDPATEERIEDVAIGSADDVSAAVAAASEGAKVWRSTPWGKRAAALRELADRIAERAEHFAQLDTLESGNPITGMRGDAAGAASDLRYFAGLAGETKGVAHPDTADMLSVTMREPFGVVGRIVPFNHPLKYAAGKAAAPLAAGNAVILKPSELTSLSTLEFARLSTDVLPDGVLNVVTGNGVVTGAAIAAHPDIPRVAFTGSVPAGQAVLRAASDAVKEVSLELGGKNPLIVFPDVDPVLAARAAVDGMNFRRSMGQSCMSQSRVFVHADVHDQFVDALGSLVADLRVGHPADEITDIGPLAYREHYQRVLGYIDSGKREGAKLLCGGGASAQFQEGFYVDPTVFDGVTDDMTIAREEIFGPVMSVLSWTDYDDMIRRVNALDLGLTANIWTNNLSVAQRTAASVAGGLVWVNGRGKKPGGVPFGGYKRSGVGREGSLDELLSYTQLKSIVFNAIE